MYFSDDKFSCDGANCKDNGGSPPVDTYGGSPPVDTYGGSPPADTYGGSPQVDTYGGGYGDSYGGL